MVYQLFDGVHRSRFPVAESLLPGVAPVSLLVRIVGLVVIRQKAVTGPTHPQARPGNSLKHHRFCRRLAIRRRKTQSLPRQVHPRRASRHFAPVYDAAWFAPVTAAGRPRSARVRHPSVRVVGGRGRHGDHRTDSDGSSRWRPLAWDLPHGPATSHTSGLSRHDSTGGPADRSAGAFRAHLHV